MDFIKLGHQYCCRYSYVYGLPVHVIWNHYQKLNTNWNGSILGSGIVAIATADHIDDVTSADQLDDIVNDDQLDDITTDDRIDDITTDDQLMFFASIFWN